MNQSPNVSFITDKAGVLGCPGVGIKEQWLSKLGMCWSPKPTPGVLKTCIFNKSPGVADGAYQGHTLRTSSRAILHTLGKQTFHVDSNFRHCILEFQQFPVDYTHSNVKSTECGIMFSGNVCLCFTFIINYKLH